MNSFSNINLFDLEVPNFLARFISISHMLIFHETTNGYG